MTNEMLETMEAIRIPASNQVVVGQFVTIDQSAETNPNNGMTAGCSGHCNGNCAVV